MFTEKGGRGMVPKKGMLVVNLTEFAGYCMVTEDEVDVSKVSPHLPKPCVLLNNGFGADLTVPVEETLPLVQTDGTAKYQKEFEEILQKNLSRAFFALARRVLKLENRVRELEKCSTS